MMHTGLLAAPAPREMDFTLDPFADWVFREPRQAQRSVTALNERTLKTLVNQFERLAAGPLPRLNRVLDQAQLVVSPQPGYGKSHLIGQLFAALEGRGTLIYVSPFQSASLCWQSILLRMVQELTFPDRRDPAAGPTPGGEPLTQLDAFAHGVLAHLIAGLMESGRVEHEDPAPAAAWLRADPLGAFMLADPEHPWSHWLRTVFDDFHPEMESALRRAGLTLRSSGWLRVLFHYASSRPGDGVRALCLAWFSGESLEPDELARLGLRSGELSLADLPDQINELCWCRLLDFCQLAAFYRPFVFCFDQTEAYGHSPELARCFGMVIAQIHLLAANEMMVVAANQQPWEVMVASRMETADKDRFIPLPLEGINRAQAEELVRLRCERHLIAPAQVEAFLDRQWLHGRFPTERNRMGIRQFLQLCSARWRSSDEWQPEVAADADKPAAAAASPPAPPPFPSLEDLLDRYSRQLQAQPKRLLFNPDAFRWLVEEAAARAPGCKVAPNAKSPRGYLPIGWTVGESRVFFGFEPGDNWKRWRSILRDAKVCCCLTPAGPDRPPAVVAKAVFFRTTEQAKIPGARWEIAAEVQAARRSFFDVLELDKQSVAQLYAARALYLDAAAGDLPYKGEQVLEFLGEELEPFWQRLCDPIADVESSGG